MCGIFGVAYREGRKLSDESKLAASADRLEHRGPDNVGIHNAEGIGLVHTRLALMDLNPRSNQPFWDPDRRFCLVYNGEIYNFQELGRELQDSGVELRTSSDTEVLLHLLLKDGVEKTLPRLEGMFAFALWDQSTQEMTIAIDRYGIKPLYTYEDAEKFIFSSEVKGMQPWFDMKPDLLSVASFIQGSGGATRDASFFEGVSRLRPGTVLKVAKGKLVSSAQYHPTGAFIDRNAMSELASKSPAQVVDEVDELMSASVRKHLLADAPVGAFCSGGIDSSIIMAMAAKSHENLAIFHANVKGPFSEYDAALELSKHLKLDLLAVDVNDRDFLELLPEAIWHYEYPFWYHPNSVPFLMVSRLVRENNVKAILSGEGADECFLGYQWLATQRLTDFVASMSSRMRKVVRRIPVFGSAITSHDDGAAPARGMLSRFEREMDEAQNKEDLSKVLGREPNAQELQCLNLLNYHLRTLLHRNDTLGMSASIEARFPFLDNPLVHYAVNLPRNKKIRFSPTVFEKAHPFVRDKWVIRKVADRYIPKVLSQRKKRGFHVTAYERMKIDSSYEMNSRFADMIEWPTSVRKYFSEVAPQSLRVQFLMLDVWSRLFLDGESKDDVRSRLLNAVSV